MSVHFSSLSPEAQAPRQRAPDSAVSPLVRVLAVLPTRSEMCPNDQQHRGLCRGLWGQMLAGWWTLVEKEGF